MSLLHSQNIFIMTELNGKNIDSSYIQRFSPLIVVLICGLAFTCAFLQLNI